MHERKNSNGRPIPILISKRKHEFTLNEEALKELLLQDHVKDSHAVVVSVAGAFRKGKSFLLNFFLRYLNHMYASSTQSNSECWLGDENAPLDGFLWRGGSERHTVGVLMWSEIFCTVLPNDEKVAIILLDTQGTFDSESTVRDCATVFAFSSMISSVQVYNLSQNIQEDDLQQLQFFADYGRLALESETVDRPFQKLQFIIRDWNYPYEFSYGDEGGTQLLQKRLKISEKQHPELQSLRQHIRSCFTEIKCFLLPFPGSKVATNSQFDGRLSEIESSFKECLQKLAPSLLAPERLVPKEIGGQKVRVHELFQYFKSYANTLNAGDLPEPKSLLLATAEANNLSAMMAARETYNRLMNEVCGPREPCVHVDQLEFEHLRCREKAIEQFQLIRKMGGEEFSKPYRVELEKNIEIDFKRLTARNDCKNAPKMHRFLHFLAIGTHYIVDAVPWNRVLKAGVGGSVTGGTIGAVGGGAETALWRTALGITVGAVLGGGFAVSFVVAKYIITHLCKSRKKMK